MLAVAMSSSLLYGVASPAGAQVRGFDGSTITVAGFGIKSQLPTIEESAQARFKAFNDNGEIKGVKIEMTEFADDSSDPATALSTARRLVAQTNVFAIVPDGSAVTPGEYLTQQKVPFFGGGFNNSYCSPKPSTKIWGFGPDGCQAPSDPSFVTAQAHSAYAAVAAKTGKKHPTYTQLGQDNQSGKNNAKTTEIGAKGVGFDVLSVNPIVPLQVSDWTPYVEKVLTADDGNPPDAISCSLAAQCIPLWSAIQARGYDGVFWSPVYSDIVVKAMGGSYATAIYADFTSKSPGIERLRKDLNAYKAGAGDKLDYGDVIGYASADLFISALKKAAAKGKSGITPENVQKAASTIKWELPGFMKTSYPKTTVMTYPVCSSMSMSNGTTWEPVETYSCSTDTFPVNSSGK
jgi:ABC-type branched-subunit amino acid transport system substrate-binding protein